MKGLKSTKSFILTRILLNRFHGKSSKDFLAIIPPEDSKKIQMQQITTQEIDAVFVDPYEFFKNIHYSWIVPYIEKLTPHLQEIVVSSLPQPLSAGLKKHLHLENVIRLPKRVGSYFVKKLYEQFYDPDTLSHEFIPKENLSQLLNLNRKDLVDLIDYLGLYDLAEEVRHLVDKESLQNIYSCLDTKKIQFVRSCLNQKAKFITPKMNLQKLDSDCNKLKVLIHQRGLYRLAKALSGCNKDFFWHFTRKLDTGRSNIISKIHREQVSPSVSAALVQQVMNVMDFLKLKE